MGGKLLRISVASFLQLKLVDKNECFVLANQRLETAVDAERSPRGQQEEDDASAAAAGGGNAVGYTTADSIRQSLLPSLPSRFDMNAIQGQVRAGRRTFTVDACGWLLIFLCLVHFITNLFLSSA